MDAKFINFRQFNEIPEILHIAGDKSCAIRALVFVALFCKGRVDIYNLPDSGDVNSVLTVLRDLGCFDVGVASRSALGVTDHSPLRHSSFSSCHSRGGGNPQQGMMDLQLRYGSPIKLGMTAWEALGTTVGEALGTTVGALGATIPPSSCDSRESGNPQQGMMGLQLRYGSPIKLGVTAWGALGMTEELGTTVGALGATIPPSSCDSRESGNPQQGMMGLQLRYGSPIKLGMTAWGALGMTAPPFSMSFSRRRESIARYDGLAVAVWIPNRVGNDSRGDGNNSIEDDDENGVGAGGDCKVGARESVGGDKTLNIVDLGNSRTGLVFVLALALIKNLPVRIVGDDSLSNRNLRDILQIAEEFGCVVRSNANYLPLEVVSGISKSPKEILCNGSAQQKSFAELLALFSKDLVTIIEENKSRDHTENLLQYMGVDKKNLLSNISEIYIPGDPSSAAFLIILAILKKRKLAIKDLCLNKYRLGFLNVISPVYNVENIRVVSGELVGDVTIVRSEVNAFSTYGINSNMLMDEYPILAVAACFAKGRSELYLPERLVNKESNRIAEITKLLDVFSVSYQLIGSILTIEGGSYCNNKKIKFTSQDHRILMSAVIMAILSENNLELGNAEIINTSFPQFFEVLGLSL